MSALIIGGGGQLGQALQLCAPDSVEVIAPRSQRLDITNAEAVKAVIREVRPDLIINAAAYTAVDRAESEEATAFSINGTAVGLLAGEARALGADFVQVSTDFVFDGHQSFPYRPNDPPKPVNVYGMSKLMGEELAGADALIVRTAWVYGPTGDNFVRTMLRLMAEKSQVRVVADQVGTPTYTPGLAAALWAMAGMRAKGIFHYTDAGVASWYDLAVAIQEEALAVGLLQKSVPVIPISTPEFPTVAQRPQYSVLDKTSSFQLLGGPSLHWRSSLRAMISDLHDRIKL